MKMDLTVLKPDLRAAVIAVATLVRDAGGRAMLVGGSVRDALLGTTDVKDVDIEVFGIEPERLKQILSTRFEFDPCGVSFGVLKIKHIDIDIALPRRETKRGIGHKGFLIDSDPALTIPEAAARRDFTINAIYYDPLGEQFEDPFNGTGDLRSGILRHVSEKFVEDPLRVLRGMQFVARFNLKPASETIEVCRKITIEDLPPERLFEEWAKLLTKGTAISAGLQFLRDVGWTRYFPELHRLIGCEQNPKWHPEGDVWNHTCLCLDSFARHRIGDYDEDLIVGLAVLCHDFGKPATTVFRKGAYRSPGHDEAGRNPTLSFLRRITNEERLLREVPPLVACHMQPFSLWRANAGDSAIRRLALRVGRIDRLVRVSRADDEGRPLELLAGERRGKDLEWLVAATERLRILDSAPKPILLGRHLIGLGYKPSAKFGEYLDACFEAQLDGAFADLPGAIDYFRKHFAK